MTTTQELENKPTSYRSTFAAEALKMGGKSADEVSRMGAVDAADDHVEDLFAARYQTVNSPIHRAVWERQTPIDLFYHATAPAALSNVAAAKVMHDSLEVVRRHRLAGTLLNDERKISETVLIELSTVGYWGLLIDAEFGGSAATFTHFSQFITQMAMLDPTVAGLASVHGCIGAVDPLITFGSLEQKARLLPLLASGERLSAFALTEPCAGTDLTALRTTATRDGDDYVINGEKLFITNVRPGRMIGIVCLIDKEPAVLIAELPPVETERFQLTKYGLHALKHAHNHGIIFRDFRVPVANHLVPKDGDGLTVAYHGLNRGRIALCANAAGTMRMMLADMLPWARFRRTYGAAIAERELVQRRIGELAGLIIACDALTVWCSGLLDLGFRGEMECVVAKIFGSESQKHAAIELHMKTLGGRSFLHGQLFGDNVHEFLAPCIYEGEGEMLGLALFKSLVKQHGRRYYEPIGKALQAHNIRQPNLMNPVHTWALRGPMFEYTKWWICHKLQSSRTGPWPDISSTMRHHAEFAASFLQAMSFEISATMRKHQLKLADRQSRMAELSSRVQTAVVILCTSMYAGRHENPTIQNAGDVLATTLTNQLLGRRSTDRHLRAQTALGAFVAKHSFPGLEDVTPSPILMPYT